MSSVTPLRVSFDELTNGGDAIAIRTGEDDGETVLASNEIPNRAEQPAA